MLCNQWTSNIEVKNMGDLKYIDAAGYIAGYLQALANNNIEPNLEELTKLTLDYIDEDSDNEYALGQIRSLIEQSISDYDKQISETNKNIKIELDQLIVLIDSIDMRLGQVVYDLEENIAFGQEESWILMPNMTMLEQTHPVARIFFPVL